MRHLLSQREEGIDIQISCALIVCILIQLISGKKPNKAMRNLINWCLMGMASEQDVIDFLNRPDNTGVKLRAKAELWKKMGFKIYGKSTTPGVPSLMLRAAGATCRNPSSPDLHR